MNIDMLIVGGYGDLALRKLYPALYLLELSGSLPEHVRIFGMARKAQERGEFHTKVQQWLRDNLAEDLYDEVTWQSFADKLYFAQGDATEPASLAEAQKKYFNKNHRLVVYLAIPPRIFGTVCSSLEACGLVTPSTRLVVEKPLGDSCESFIAINEELSRVFPEDQLFRIDHYLGKESVQNLIALRFANDIFEPLWNSKYVDHIQITVTETVGTGNRWSFYDETGAVRDMMQNHLLQVLCLVAMEPPSTLDAECVRGEKLKVLRCLKTLEGDTINDVSVRGQYRHGTVSGESVPGYLDEEGSRADSQTETFVVLKAEIENWRWSGVPIYLRTGKRLSQRHSEIVIQFKQSHHKIFNEHHSRHNANQLIIQLQPDAGISLRVMNKVAGLEEGIPLESGYLDISFSETDKVKKHNAYSRLLFDVFRGDQTLFVSAAEVETAWTWIDQIFAGWAESNTPISDYTAGSSGPIEANNLMTRDGRRWNS